MDADTEESCTQYNILKVARYIYTWNGDSFMMDYYERAIMNGLVGNLNMETPQYFYFNPLGGGGLTKLCLYFSIIYLYNIYTQTMG